MNACEAGQLEAARILIDFEPDLLLYVCQNGSPLHAAISGRLPYVTVKLLISRDVLVNKPDLSNVSPLYLAVFTGHPEVVQALLDAGARPSIDNYAQEPLLHVCAERGFVEIAKALLKVEPLLVEGLDSKENLALHVAAEWDQLAIAKLICDVGDGACLIKVKNEEGQTCVDIAYEENTQEVYPYLCQRYDIKLSWSFWCSLF